MTAMLLPMPFLTALDADGEPISGAKAYFYSTGTTTNATVYKTSALSTTHEQPVVADSAGRFAAIYLQDTNAAYRIKLFTAADVLVADIDPINRVGGTIGTSDLANLAVTNAKMAVGAAADNLGYVALNKAGDSATDLDLVHVTPNAASAGYMGAPPVTANADTTLILTHAGKTLLHTDATPRAYTIPLAASVAFADETYLVIRNMGSGAVTITRTGGVALRGEGSGTDKNWTLAQYGKAVISKYTGDTWTISGSGLT